MGIFAGLDVGDKATHVCVVDGEGLVVWRGACATDPAVLRSGGVPVTVHHFDQRRDERAALCAHLINALSPNFQ